MLTRLTFLLILITAFAGAQQPLRVGMDMSYPPFEMRDKDGAPAGISVDLARALGESLGRPVEFLNMPFDGLIPSLKTGRIDIILSSMTATEERALSVDFSEPYLRTGLCLLLSSTAGEINSVADIDREGKKIAVVKGTTGHLWAVANLKHARPLVLAKETAGVLEVTQGKADAFIYDQMSTLRNWLANRDKTRAILKPFREESWAIALRKGDALRDKVNAFLTGYRGSGGFDRLGDKWLKEQKIEFMKLGVPFVF